MSQLKIGFVGCGKHAKLNIYPSVKLLGYDIQSVSARHLDRAEATATQFHAKKAYENYQKLLEESLDVVFVITSGDQHAKIVTDCLQAGAHVFVEKPLGWNATEAQHIADVAQKVQKHVMVGFMKRFAPSYLQLKKIMHQENFGPILSMTGMFGIRAFGDEEGYLKYGAIHFVDLIRFLFGEINDVHGYKRLIGKDVAYIFSYSSQQGYIGNMFFAGLPAWGKHHEEITVTGLNGYVKVDNMKRVQSHIDIANNSAAPRWQLMDEEETVITSINTSSSGGFQDLYINGYVGEVAHFLSSIENGHAPQPDALDNVNTMRLADRLLAELVDPTKKSN